MGKALQSIRGMNDILPHQTPAWQHVEHQLFQLAKAYAFQEIRMPMVESMDLFKRSVGEVTDIVAKEMYVFADRNGDVLALRPEGTASCVRSVLQHGLSHHQTQKLWYYGPMFRHERPQQGRYRQFYQFGLETIGIASPDAELEQIACMTRFWRQFDIQDALELQINTLGTAATRQSYRSALVAYLQDYIDDLDPDSRERLDRNPLRILDSKDPHTQAILKGAPLLSDHWDNETTEHFDALQALLKGLKISFVVNPGLVRGLDYYNKTVFEWVTNELGTQGTVCAGGRYDQLLEQLGGHETPAVGLAMGMERFLSLLTHRHYAYPIKPYHAYAIMAGSDAKQVGLPLLEALRDRHPGLRLQINLGEGSIKSQFKKADKSGANLALVIGDEAYANRQIVVKFLRDDRPQQIISHADLLQGWLTTVCEDL